MLCQNEAYYVALKILALLGVMSLICTVGAVSFLLLSTWSMKDEISRSGNSIK